VTTSGAALFVRFTVSMIVVLALIALCTVLYRRSRSWTGARRSGAPVEILARQALSRRAQVVVVRAGTRHLVLGVTDTSVQVLGETELVADEATAHDGAPAPTQSEVASRTASPVGAVALARSWRDLVEGMRERTVRRS
jgi:flagellar biogenesis protein FliO